MNNRDLAQKAFILAIREVMPGLKPKAEDVEFEPRLVDVMARELKPFWKKGGVRIQGFFYKLKQPDGGAVCIINIRNDNAPYAHYEKSGHHFSNIREEYDAYRQALN